MESDEKLEKERKRGNFQITLDMQEKKDYSTDIRVYDGLVFLLHLNKELKSTIKEHRENVKRINKEIPISSI